MYIYMYCMCVRQRFLYICLAGSPLYCSNCFICACMYVQYLCHPFLVISTNPSYTFKLRNSHSLSSPFSPFRRPLDIYAYHITKLTNNYIFHLSMYVFVHLQSLLNSLLFLSQTMPPSSLLMHFRSQPFLQPLHANSPKSCFTTYSSL